MKAYSKLGISVLSTLLDISGYRPGKRLMCPLAVKVKLHIYIIWTEGNMNKKNTINILDQYNNDEFVKIVADSYSYNDLCRKLGYNCYSGGTIKRIKKRIEYLNIPIDHFRSAFPHKIIETDIFIKNSTVSQNTLRKHYKNGNYSIYKCSICGQLPLWNNKKLTLILDHINGDNHDNTLENLRWVCPNCNRQLDTTNCRHKKPLNHCIVCNRVISSCSTRCMICANKYRSEKAKATLPPISRQELKDLIRTETFVNIGRQYNLSDNTIRKWCKKYNLPSKSKDIKMITDEDWEKI
jgi:hypothetical protein